MLICWKNGDWEVKCFFFFQAEDGIRDIGVTGVQTCALPILIICQVRKQFDWSLETM